MKIKKYAMILACAGAMVLSALNFQNSASYVSDETTDVSLTLNDLFTVAFATGEEDDPIGSKCSGSTCSEANGLKYNTMVTSLSTTCCGASSTSSGKRAS